MFTGLVTHKAKITRRETEGDRGALLALSNPFSPGEPPIVGESVAIDGCCLTVLPDTTGTWSELQFFVSLETLRSTALGELSPGDTVNLERALRVGDRLGGHLVSGHIDCVGRLKSVSSEGDSQALVFSYPGGFAELLITKGSIAVNGVSLTVNEVTDTAHEHTFSVNIIPHTSAETNLGALAVDAPVNLEFDLIGKYQRRAREVAALADTPTYTESGRTAPHWE
ncbi:MAG TPA: riboflavin synthase [candidate division Zixibacteria bacterium]|nr:riboflavin synthase [candidate division Zixibacteria bacterium]